MSKLVYSIFVEASIAGLVIPPIIITLVNYFVYDLKEESYSLPTPVMYVKQHLIPYQFRLGENFLIYFYFLKGYHSIGIHLSDISRLFLLKLEQVLLHFYVLLHLYVFSLELAGYLSTLLKILQTICLLWMLVKHRTVIARKWWNPSVLSYNRIQMWQS